LVTEVLGARKAVAKPRFETPPAELPAVEPEVIYKGLFPYLYPGGGALGWRHMPKPISKTQIHKVFLKKRGVGGGDGGW